MGFDVTQGRSQKMTFSSSGNNNAGIQVSWMQDYCVDVTGGDVATHTALDVITATGIPLVNYTVFSTATTIMPWVICRDKTAKQNPDRLSRWVVSAKFQSPASRGGGQGTTSSQEAENLPIPIPVDIDSISPSETSDFSSLERVLYFEKGDGWLDPQLKRNTATTPTGNWWSTPVTEKLPVLELKISQYEDSIDYDKMLARLYKCNDADYRDKKAGSWLITDVEATEVAVTLQSGPAVKALVTYTIALSPWPLTGWREQRGLFDTQYFEEDEENPGQPSDKLKLFQSQIPGKPNAGYITDTGLKRASQTGFPDYIYYEVFDYIPFGFLQA